MTPQEQIEHFTALLRAGYAIEIDNRCVYPIVPAPNSFEEELAVLGIRMTSDDSEPSGEPPSRRWPTTEELRTHDVDDTTDRTPTMWVSESETYLNARTVTGTPPDAVKGGLGGLLDRVSEVLARPSGVLLLAHQLPARVGLHGRTPRTDRAGKFLTDTTALQSARARGWSISAERPWMTFWRNEIDGDGRKVPRVIHVGVMPWITSDIFPMIHPDPAVIMRRMWQWYAALGEPYHGEGPGLVGVGLMRDHLPPRTKKENVPTWCPEWSGRCVPALQGATELPDNWTSPRAHEHRFEHVYDVTTQYLSAAGSVSLSPGPLHYSGLMEAFTPTRNNRPGYYLITVPKMWNYTDVIPHPVGRYRVGDRVWVAHPTLDLLVHCAQELEIMDLPMVHEAWTGTHGTRVLRGWSAKIAQAVRFMHTIRLANPDDAVMFDAVKGTYKDGRGMLHVATSRVYRPDWGHAIIAQARTLLWLKIWAEGIGGRKETASNPAVRASGRWPVAVAADAVTYSSDTEDPHAPGAWPQTFLVGDGITGGTFVVKGTREVVR